MIRSLLACIAFLCCVGMMAYGCTTAPAVVTASAATPSVQAAVGDEVNIQLSENPSTGWTWRLQSPLNGILQAGGDRFVRSSSAGADLVGTGGTRVLTYTAVGAGTIELAYALAGPGRDVEAADHRMTFTVHVTN
jgi:predicted secreted protein